MTGESKIIIIVVRGLSCPYSLFSSLVYSDEQQPRTDSLPHTGLTAGANTNDLNDLKRKYTHIYNVTHTHTHTHTTVNIAMKPGQTVFTVPFKSLGASFVSRCLFFDE